MGLDSVELVIEIEEAFDIAIPDVDASKFRTVGDVYRHVLSKLEASRPSKCLSAEVFYRFRRALGEALGVPRDRVRLATTLDELVPGPGRRAAWRSLETTLGMKLPPLRYPAGFEEMTSLVTMGSALLLGALTLLELPLPPGVPRASVLGVLAAIPLVAIVAHLLERPLAVHVPHNCGSVRTLVLAIARTNYGLGATREKSWSREEVWRTLREVIAGQLGITLDEIREEHRFVEDLWVD